MGIAWIASYPKSGNTWVRFLVHNLMYGPAESSASLNVRIPPIMKQRAFDVPAGTLVCSKTHFVFGPSHPRADETAKAIVILRNPRDVALSCLNYRRMGGVLPPTVTDADYLRLFIRHRGDPDFARLGFGTWAQHADSWTGDLGFPTLVLRYESMKSDAIDAATRIAAFLGVDADGPAIRAAAEASDARRVRAMEERERAHASAGTIFRSTTPGRYFVNKGAIGQRLDSVEPGLDAAFDEAFAADAARFGYAIEPEG